MGCGGWPYARDCQPCYISEGLASNGRQSMSQLSRQERKSVKLTISRRARWVPTEVLWRARRRVKTWRALRSASKLWRHTVWRIAVLRRRSEAWAALVGAASHYAAEEIARSMTDLRRLRLRGTMVVRALTGATALLELTFELRDSVFVPVPLVNNKLLFRPLQLRVLGLHLVVLVLERVDFAADELDLLDVTGDYTSRLARPRGP